MVTPWHSSFNLVRASFLKFHHFSPYTLLKFFPQQHSPALLFRSLSNSADSIGEVSFLLIGSFSGVFEATKQNNQKQQQEKPLKNSKLRSLLRVYVRALLLNFDFSGALRRARREG